MPNVHYGHIFHLAGSPKVTEAADALVSIPDGALVVGDDGRIAFCGESRNSRPNTSPATVHDHRGGYLLPGFVDTHIHFPQTYAGDSYGGGQLLEWLNLCMFPSESQVRRPRVRAAGGGGLQHAADRGRHHRRHGVRLGVPTRAGRAVQSRRRRPACASSAAGASRPSRPDTRQAADHLRGGRDPADPRGDREVARRRHRRRRHRAAARRDRAAVLAVGDHRDVQGPRRAVRRRPRPRRVRPHPPQREQPARHRRGRLAPSRSTRWIRTSTPTTASSCPDRRWVAAACWAGAASSPTACTARTSSWSGWPRPARRSRIARSRSCSSARAPCRGSAPSPRA